MQFAWPEIIIKSTALPEVFLPRIQCKPGRVVFVKRKEECAAKRPIENEYAVAGCFCARLPQGKDKNARCREKALLAGAGR